MKLVIQRVKYASVEVGGEITGQIAHGMMILVGIEVGDTEADCDKLVAKTVALRIFNDDKGVMNRSIADVDGSVLAVSQFTLLADTTHGNRPSYVNAARPDDAIPLYDRYCVGIESQLGRKTGRGVFGADMRVELVNDGPVTIIMECRNGKMC